MSARQPLPPAEAVAAFSETAAGADAVLRSIARHRSWHVGGDRNGTVTRAAVAREDDGSITLRAWSTSQNYASAVAAGDAQQSSFELPGWELLPLVGKMGVDRVVFDAAGSHSVHYMADQFDLLAAWAATAAVEQAVEDAESISAPMATMLRYSGWVLLHETIDGLPALVMAPDSQGRVLAAVFTAHDAAESFRVANRESLTDEVSQAVRTGRDLFAWLGSLAIDGFVINPGPLLRPRAFALGVCEHIVRAAP